MILQSSSTGLLIRVIAKKDFMANLHNLLTFHVDAQLYALPVECVVQIVSMVTITPIPQASSIAEGIINVHGEVVPVVNLRSHLSKPRRQYDFYTPIILIKIEEHTIGLIVDVVNNVISQLATDIVHPTEMLPDELRNISLLNGVAYTPEGVMLILDPEELFKPEQIQALCMASIYLHEMISGGKLEKWPQP